VFENESFSQEQFVWLLGAACRLHRIPFDARLALQQFPPPHALEGLRSALVALGFREGLADLSAADLADLPGPCFVALKGAGDGTDFALLLRCDGSRALLVRSGQAEPEEVSFADLECGYAGACLQFAPEPRSLKDDDTTQAEDASASPKQFGFRWFVPELLKHKAVWREVLLASLAIQLVGLATPLFTQVVIDKVVVHQSLSTLAVIGIGLFVFMLFNAAMGWVRQYLLLHTGNRVDAVLGTRVFEHLLGLSPRYFEHRPTGVVVARLHGVETIREFVSGAAVSLLLDLPFLFIFLAVMFWYSWQLSLIAVGLLGAVTFLSAIVTPVFRSRLNRQFLVGARNQAFLTEYVAGFETVKSLQMEPLLKTRYGDYLAEYLAAAFRTRQLSNTYSTAASSLEQMMTLAILCVGACLPSPNT
jgi:subfamily B ATP-binding cassette protein HlyB/CyaB